MGLRCMVIHQVSFPTLLAIRLGSARGQLCASGAQATAEVPAATARGIQLGILRPLPDSRSFLLPRAQPPRRSRSFLP